MKKWLCIIISVVMLLAAAAMPACRDEGAYKAKTEREQLLLDYFDAANRKDYTEWVNYYLAGSLRDRAQQETEKGYLDIETTTVNDIKLVDSKYCEVWVSSQLSVYEDAGKPDEAPDYLTDPDKLEYYFVCMDVKVHEGIEQDYMTKDGHRDQLFVLVQVDGNWYIAYSTIMFEMDGYDLDSFHNYTPDPS